MIIQDLGQVKARIFQYIKFSLSEHALDKGIGV
jgi:hypothetical protein